MGIINCTPDSFFSGSRVQGETNLRVHARRMIDDGADILDIGGESTRPGALPVPADEQIRRVVPGIRAIREEFDIPISIDTQSAVVAQAALDAGADIINDISSLSDKNMASLAAERQAALVLMHIQGSPRDMQNNPTYLNTSIEVRDALKRTADKALDAGISPEKLILDPGIGFGKRHRDNLELLARIDLWRLTGHPILIGLSRKSFLGRIIEADKPGNGGGFSPESGFFAVDRACVSDDDCGSPEHAPALKLPGEEIAVPQNKAEDRFAATMAAHAWCLNNNIDILRVHDVKETRQLIAVWEALTWAS